MGILDTPHQVEMERAALAALATPEVAAAVREIEQLYAAGATGATPDGAATAAAAARAITHAAVKYALAEADTGMRVQWTANAAHAWHGLEVPSSGYGIDNPDNVHRNTGVDPLAEFRILGRARDGAPQQQTFILYAELPGTGEMGREGAEIIDVVVHVPTPGERFEITVGPEPDGGPLHLCTRGRARFLIVRDALGDWGRDLPTELTIEPRPQDEQVLDHTKAAARAAELAPQIARYWLEYNNLYLWSREPNRLLTPRLRAFGAAASTTFSLAPETCLLVTVDPTGAGYVGCQLTDPWGVALEYVGRTGSLNQAQARRNADGTITYVVGAVDPGIHNWLDTGGLHNGMLTLRWQSFAETPSDLDGAVRECRLVPAADVAALLAEQAVGSEEREQQMEQRSLDYGRRLS